MMSGVQKNWIMSGITLISPLLQSALVFSSILTQWTHTFTVNIIFYKDPKLVQLVQISWMHFHLFSINQFFVHLFMLNLGQFVLFVSNVLLDIAALVVDIFQCKVANCKIGLSMLEMIPIRYLHTHYTVCTMLITTSRLPCHTNFDDSTSRWIATSMLQTSSGHQKIRSKGEKIAKNCKNWDIRLDTSKQHFLRQSIPVQIMNILQNIFLILRSCCVI